MVLLMDGEGNLMEETAVIEDSNDVEFACGDPKVEPRIGDEYQVEIPLRMSASNRAAYLLNPLEDSLHSFLVGQPVQVTWIDKQRNGQGNGDDNVDMNQSLRSLRTKKSRCSTKISGKSGECIESKKPKLNLEAVPEVTSSSWEDAEVASFVLGLYTFGKNFSQVKKFMESERTGEIVLFYYGKFYNSAKYHSWSESRKKRNRKCVCGKKLYTGWRQDQLLSRLIPSIQDESQKQMLMNISKSFAEGNVTLEKYVSQVKGLVGLKLLVDAVAIGKEKKDLTVLRAAPMKTEPWFTVSSKPSSVSGLGPYASLTSAGIINTLTGSSRLSKAHCNDIFWDAVWPRLLERGWRSEQPKDQGYFKSKDYIVFMVPGVKTFSRQELVKGDHYFDSISDILAKVVAEPELLELEKGDNVKNAAANEFVVAEDSSDQSNEESSLSRSQRLRYLRSPFSNRGTQRMKFTVVDTSLDAGGKLWELRNLNVESVVCEPKTCQGGKDSSTLENSVKRKNVDKSQVRPLDAKNQVTDQMRFTIIDTSLEHREKISGFRGWRHLPCDDTKKGCVKADSGIKEKKTLTNVKDPSTKSNKHRIKPRADTHSVSSAPYLKRRRLSACMSSETPVFKHLPGDDTKMTVGLESEQPSIYVVLHQNTTCEEMNQEKEKFETVIPVEHRNSKCDQSKKTGTGPPSSLVGIQEISEKKPNGVSSISYIDKHCSLEKIVTANELISSAQESNGLGSVSGSDKKRVSNDLKPKQAVKVPSISGSNINSSPSNDLGTTLELGSSEQQQEHIQPINADGPKRLSTRKRPLTTRALEALETDFVTAKRIKSTTVPRKRQSPTKKKRSAKSCNRSQLLSDNRSADLKKRGEYRMILERKAPESKPSDQIEDSKPSFLPNETRNESTALDRRQDSVPVLTEYPKLPPIVFKFPIKRS